MKKELFQEIEIPEGVEAEIEGNSLKIKGPEGEVERRFDIDNLVFEKKENKILIGNKKSTRREKKLMNTLTAHISNLIEGVQKKFEYKLKICYSHFPFTVEIKDREVIIKNFLGEKVPRKVNLPKGVEAEVDKEYITIKSANKESAGQAAANLERATKIRGRDIRVFQDGIYIVNKAGKDI